LFIPDLDYGIVKISKVFECGGRATGNIGVEMQLMHYRGVAEVSYAAC
jgi:hypothetical protein